MPRHPGGGHARRGTSRQRAHKPCLRAPHRRIPPLLTLPQHIYYSTFRPKRKGFSFIIIVFCFGRGGMLFSVKALRFCNDKNQVTGVCTAKGSRGRAQSPLVAPAGAKSPRNKKIQATWECNAKESRGRPQSPLVASADAKPLHNKRKQSLFPPKSNEIKRNQMKSNFLDEHPFPVLQYHCRNSGE